MTAAVDLIDRFFESNDPTCRDATVATTYSLFIGNSGDKLFLEPPPCLTTATWMVR
jgi:hypothetical protein